MSALRTLKFGLEHACTATPQDFALKGKLKDMGWLSKWEINFLLWQPGSVLTPGTALGEVVAFPPADHTLCSDQVC